jgi:hypothetical protein
MHNSCNIHSIANSYTVTDKLHRAGDRLSITGCRQPTDCGCSSFHPTIGTEAFILSTLATPMPSHDITRNSHTSRGLFLCFRFCLGPVLCNSEVSLSVMASARFLRCSSASSSRPSVRDSLESSAHLPCELTLLSFGLPSPVCIPLTLEGFADLSCSFCQKEAQVCRSLRYFELTAHVSIHGGGW